MKLIGFWPSQKNVNQSKILKIEILCKILHTAEYFIKMVVGEKHFELECQLSWYFKSTGVKFYWILARIWKNQENHCFLGIGWFIDQMALKQKLRKANMLCRSFSVLEIFETCPTFHIKLVFSLQWLIKSGLFEGCTHNLFIIAWRFLTWKQFSCLECKPQLPM